MSFTIRVMSQDLPADAVTVFKLGNLTNYLKGKDFVNFLSSHIETSMVSIIVFDVKGVLSFHR